MHLSASVTAHRRHRAEYAGAYANTIRFFLLVSFSWDFSEPLPAQPGVKIIKFYGAEKICQWNLDANRRESSCKWSCGNLHGPIKTMLRGLAKRNPVIFLFLPARPAYLAGANLSDIYYLPVVTKSDSFIATFISIKEDICWLFLCVMWDDITSEERSWRQREDIYKSRVVKINSKQSCKIIRARHKTWTLRLRLDFWGILQYFFGFSN